MEQRVGCVVDDDDDDVDDDDDDDDGGDDGNEDADDSGDDGDDGDDGDGGTDEIENKDNPQLSFDDLSRLEQWLYTNFKMPELSVSVGVLKVPEIPVEERNNYDAG